MTSPDLSSLRLSVLAKGRLHGAPPHDRPAATSTRGRKQEIRLQAENKSRLSISQALNLINILI